MGLIETEAKAQGVTYEKGTFPWAASDRALSLGRDDGATKLVIDPRRGGCSAPGSASTPAS